jgi:UDP-N-acetylmuramate dehydrogenase
MAFFPNSMEELVALVETLKLEGIRYQVLGNLTNVLPLDGIADFVVVSTKRMTGLVMGNRVFVYAGTTSNALLRACKREKRGGAEFLSGIPCTLGGALYMNAGAGGKYISEIVESVTVLRDGKMHILPLKDCAYAYKQSVFMQNEDVILGASLNLEKTTDEEIAKNELYYLSRRKHLPKGRSMGCVFKNPPSVFAGELIEKSGLKGVRIGGAKISEEHANFIINEKNATAKDIRALIALAKDRVQARYGVCLEEEIRYLE